MSRFISGLTSTNSVPAIKSTHWLALTTLLDANLSGGSKSVSAIQNLDNGKLYARNLTTSGYKSALQNNSTVVHGASYTEYAYPSINQLFPSPQLELNLPVEETPTYHDNDFNNWANVVNFGARPTQDPSHDRDASDAIQRAIDSGKSTIYFPAGSYRITKPIIIRGNVKKIVGMESEIELLNGHVFTDPANPKPILSVQNTNSDTVIIEGVTKTLDIIGQPLTTCFST